MQHFVTNHFSQVSNLFTLKHVSIDALRREGNVHRLGAGLHLVHIASDNEA